MGTLVAAQSRARVLAMPYEGTIAAMAVHDGERVRAGQSLVTLARAPTTDVATAQAKAALTFATEDLARMKRLHELQLASNDQLAAAERTLSDAQAVWRAVEKTGAATETTILHAPFAGIVTSLALAVGDRPAVGSALLTLASGTDLVVQLGVEPEDSTSLVAGASVSLFRRADDPAPIAAKLLMVGHAMDVNTRLVNAVVALAPKAASGLTLGATLEAHIAMPPRRGLLVPRPALLEDSQGAYLFTLANGKAHLRRVGVLAETADQALLGNGISEQELVVVGGNTGLEDDVAAAESPATNAGEKTP